MATYESDTLIQTKDNAGDVYIHYPITKGENALLSETAKSALGVTGDDANVENGLLKVNENVGGVEEAVNGLPEEFWSLLYGPGVEYENTPGLAVLQLPPHTKKIRVTACAGGGGGGGNGPTTSLDEGGGGGGGGENLQNQEIAIAEGDTIQIQIGAGGGPNLDGEDTVIYKNGAALYTLAGGKHATAGELGAGGAAGGTSAGAGGISGEKANTYTNMNGTAGEDGSLGSGGAGGTGVSSGGTHFFGGGGGGGSLGNGGQGANGRSSSSAVTNGGNGVRGGGGGGGAYSAGSSTPGSGGCGYCKVEWFYS